MTTISGSFDAVGAGSQLMVRPGESFTYALEVAAEESFVGIVLLQRSDNGQAWEVLETFEGTEGTPLEGEAASGTVANNGDKDAFYRLQCTSIDETSDAISFELADVGDEKVRDVRFENGQFIRGSGGKVLAEFDEDGLVVPALKVAGTALAAGASAEVVITGVGTLTFVDGIMTDFTAE